MFVSSLCVRMITEIIFQTERSADYADLNGHKTESETSSCESSTGLQAHQKNGARTAKPRKKKLRRGNHLAGAAICAFRIIAAVPPPATLQRLAKGGWALAVQAAYLERN
jgi:hypothetical protein